MKWVNDWFSRGKKKSFAFVAEEAIDIHPMEPNSLRAKGMDFTVHRANGGHIVEYHEYDANTDRNSHKLHIIPADKDLGQELAHIITYQLLRN
jgi:hypothetical protein